MGQTYTTAKEASGVVVMRCMVHPCKLLFARGRGRLTWLLSQGAHAGVALVAAAAVHDVGILQQLLEHQHGGDVGVHGQCALANAIHHKNVGATQLLLKAGTPTNTETMTQELYHTLSGYRAWLREELSFSKPEESAALYGAAVKYGHTEFAEMLAKAGAKST
jgi:hypothetical protein